jgi:hypothetical protein
LLQVVKGFEFSNRHNWFGFGSRHAPRALMCTNIRDGIPRS